MSSPHNHARPDDSQDDAPVTTSTDSYTVADYLFDRVFEAGANEVLGVPGDFNLPFLDNVIAHDSLRWVGNNNELNAGYCADGYARLRGFAAVVTTFGVGELSMINATAGSYAEYAPVLHIVGAPATATQNSGRKVHHTLGDGKFTHFYDMARRVNCAQAWITPANAAVEIDRVIRHILTERRPGYLVLSPDVARAPIYRPEITLSSGLSTTSSSAAIAAFEKAMTEFLQGANATILADLLVHRLGAWDNFRTMLGSTDLPYATLAWGKSLVDEENDRFAGIYAGAASDDRPRAAVEEADRLISIGVEFTDNTTAGFSMELDQERMISLDPHQASVASRAYAPIDIADAIDALGRVLSRANVEAYPLAEAEEKKAKHGKDDEPLRQDHLWDIMADWLPQDSIMVADQGTSYFGMADRPLPAGTMFIGQPLWGSIGYTLPASLGAALADRDRRAVLLIGDGSAQLTVQEISTMVREKTNPLVVIINNDGYTVERAIHGADQPYNDIPAYDWQIIPYAFGASEETCLTLKATTPEELRVALHSADAARDKLVLLEIMMDRDDVPQLLQATTEALSRNSRL